VEAQNRAASAAETAAAAGRRTGNGMNMGFLLRALAGGLMKDTQRPPRAGPALPKNHHFDGLTIEMHG
jgi:hypothetical protein